MLRWTLPVSDPAWLDLVLNGVLPLCGPGVVEGMATFNQLFNSFQPVPHSNVRQRTESRKVLLF